MSLRLRLLLAVGYILLLIIVALEVPLALNLARRVDAEVKSDAASQAFIVAAGASGRMDQRGSLQRLAEGAANDLGARVIVVGRRGVLLADSAGPGLIGTRYSDAARPELQTALGGRSEQIERHSDTLGADQLFTAVPVTNSGNVVGAVRVTQPTAEIDERVRRSVLALIAIGFFALLLGLGLTWVLAETLSRPLRRLAGTAREVEAGNLEARAAVIGATEQKEVAHAFNDMTERLGLVLGSQREFVANASHQLRTPLTGLRLRLESAAAKAGSPELEAELHAAEAEVERLARLLTALLTLAREGQGPAPGRAVHLSDAVRRARDRWETRAEQQDQRVSVVDGPEVAACASEEDVAIILDNLVENALHYSPPGARVRLEWGGGGEEVFVAVLDDGPGVAPGEEDALFERFARGSAGQGSSGSGLGLAIVRMLARRWRGDAAIRNRAEGGARAEVRLPAADEATLQSPNPRLDEALLG